MGLKNSFEVFQERRKIFASLVSDDGGWESHKVLKDMERLLYACVITEQAALVSTNCKLMSLNSIKNGEWDP